MKSEQLSRDDGEAAKQLAAYSDERLAKLFFANGFLLALARCGPKYDEKTNVFARTHRLVIEEGTRRGLKMKDGLH